LDKLRADRESSALLKGGDADEIKGGALVVCEENSEEGRKAVMRDGLCGQDVDDVKEVYLKG
jgi:hypothetical protein